MLKRSRGIIIMWRFGSRRGEIIIDSLITEGGGRRFRLEL